MRQNFTVAGPFGELSGVINLCEVETKRRNVLVKAADGLRNWRMKSENPFALWFVLISAGVPCLPIKLRS